MPVDYDEMFGGGAMGAHFALQDRDLEREKAQGAIQQQNLANMFAEQNNPMRLQEQQLQLDGLGYDNQVKAQTAQLAPLKYNAEQADFIQKIKKAELDGMQLEAQRMAYSPDKAISEEGQRMLLLHRDFLKLREQGTQKQELEGVKIDARKERDQTLQGNRIQLKQIAPARSGGGAAKAPTAPGSDKEWTSYMRSALEAAEAGKDDEAKRWKLRADALITAKNQGKPDPNLGKSVLTPEGIGPAPARQGWQLPPARTAAPKPSLPSGWVMK